MWQVQYKLNNGIQIISINTNINITMKSSYMAISLKAWSPNKTSCNQMQILPLTSVTGTLLCYLQKPLPGSWLWLKSTIHVTTAVWPPRLKCPVAKPHSHDHSMMGILKCSGIFRSATSPRDLILIKEREWPRGTEWEAKCPASGFSWIKLGKLKGMFSITAIGKGRLWTSSNASELEAYLKWKIITSIFSGALFK